MEEILFHDLYDYNYSVKVLNALKQRWDTYNSFSCIGAPKEKNMLLYLHDCSAVYTTKSGDRIYANSGDIVFTPINYEYTVKLYDLKPGSYTIGVNFFIYDKNDRLFIPDRNIRIFSLNSPSVATHFETLEKNSSSAVSSPAKMKSALYEILSFISLSLRNERLTNQKYSIIAEGIKYLENDESQTLCIKALADMCHVSEVYFRKLFTEYSGFSPIQYRLRSKI